jgi:3-phenylpropionate/trans-cinnamate dioxygenase ferredoxin reductase subunit
MLGCRQFAQSYRLRARENSDAATRRYRNRRDGVAGIVIVGAGQAAATLAETLRRRGHDGPVTIIGDEADPPYQRPPLSKKYLTGEIARERLYLRPPQAWADDGITIRIRTRATGIDRAARRVDLSDGSTLTYDRLVLATGSVPRRLPDGIGGNLPGVFSIRSLADADAMAPHLRHNARLVVIGGGYIGLEAAAVARRRGLHVTVIEAAPRILGRVAAPETAAWFLALHRTQGVTVIEGAALARLEGDSAVQRAVLADGRVLPADLVVAGIGIQPATALAEDAGLAIDNGIAVDAFCATSDPDIFAIGDCASFPQDNRRLRLESVPNAIDMGAALAATLTGAPQPYVARPWFWSDQYEVKLQIAGLNAGYDRVVARPGPREGTQSVWYFQGRTLLAVDAMNDPRAYMTGKRWIEAGQSPNPAAIADAARDLRDISVA